MKRFTERGGWWVAAQVVIFAVVAIAGWYRPVAVAGSGAAAAIRSVAGWMLIGAGGGGAVAAMVHLGPSLTPYPAPLAGSRFASGGVYRLVRHPIYGGVTLMSVGYAVVRGDVLAVLLALTLIPFFLAKATFEERFLLARYPDYDDYRRRVRHRLFPGLL